MDTSTSLSTAIAAARAGKRREAQDLLRQIVKREPNNEVAWFWLSEVAETLDEQITALESALFIAPHNPQAIERLETLYAQQESTAKDRQQELMRTAEAARRAGHTKEAHSILLRTVEEFENNQTAWLMLSELIDDPQDQIAALEHAVQLNPKNTRLSSRLTLLKRFKNDWLSLGDLYRDDGQMARARETYLKVAAHAKNGLERAEADRRVAALNWLAEIPDFKRFDQTFTWIRLSLGPIALYSLLALLFGGLNPEQIPSLLYAAGISVVIGSVLVAGTATPRHIVWQLIFGVVGLSVPAMRRVIGGIGLLLVLAPYVLLMDMAIARLPSYLF
jgi:tetratricopeptide (TPR) repeat protein